MKLINKLTAWTLLSIILFSGFKAGTNNDIELRDRDVKEIKSKSRLVINELEAMLNLMTNAEVFQSEVQEVIENSYSEDNVNRIFRDRKVIVEDDLNPEVSSSKQAANLDVHFYLSNFNLNYEKTYDYSIEFSDIKVSEIYYRDHLFLKVGFKRKYGSKHKRYQHQFEEVDRIAEIEIQKNENGGWEVFIVGLRFADQLGIIAEAPTISIIKQRVEFQNESVDTEVTGEEVVLESRQNAIFYVVEDKETAAYNENMQFGNRAFKDERFEDAVAAFMEARKIRTNDPKSSVMLSRSQLKLEEQRGLGSLKLFEIYKKQGMMSEYRGEFEIAKKVYLRALEINPKDQAVLARYKSLETRIAARDEVEKYFMAYGNNPKSKDLLKMTRSNPRNPDYKLGLAKAYFLERDPKGDIKKSKEVRTAMVVLNDALKLEPEFKDAIIFQAELFSLLGEYEKSLKEFGELIQNEKDESDLFYRRSLVKLISNDTVGAIADLNIASLQNPNDVKSNLELGKIFYRKSDFHSSAQYFGKAAVFERNNPSYHYFHALSLAEFDMSSAVKSFRIAKELGTDSLEVRIIDQVKSFSEKTYNNRNETGLEQALGNVNELLSLGYEPSMVLFRKAQILKELNRLVESKETLESILDNDPKLISPALTLGEVYFLLGEHSKSLTIYKGLETILISSKTTSGPLMVKVSTGLGDNYLKIGEYSMAYGYFQKALASDNANPEIYLKLGQSKMGLKDFKQASKDFSTGLKLYPENISLLYHRGVSSFFEQNYSSSSKDLNRAKVGKYMESETSYYLGKISIESGNSKEALEYFKESAKLNPDNQELYLHIYILELWMGNIQQAESAINSLSKISSPSSYEVPVSQSYLSLAKNDIGEAARIQTALLNQDSNHGKILFLTGIVFYMQGKTDLSIDILDRALKSNALSNTEIRYNPFFIKMQSDKKIQRISKPYLK